MFTKCSVYNLMDHSVGKYKLFMSKSALFPCQIHMDHALEIYHTWTYCPSLVLSALSGCVLEGRICAPGNSSAMRCVNAGSFSNSSPR